MAINKWWPPSQLPGGQKYLLATKICGNILERSPEQASPISQLFSSFIIREAHIVQYKATSHLLSIFPLFHKLNFCFSWRIFFFNLMTLIYWLFCETYFFVCLTKYVDGLFWSLTVEQCRSKVKIAKNWEERTGEWSNDFSSSFESLPASFESCCSDSAGGGRYFFCRRMTEWCSW